MDVAGLQVAPGASLVLVGYLVQHSDGWQVRMPPDKARATMYAAKQHATIEPLFVLRANAPAACQISASEAIAGGVGLP